MWENKMPKVVTLGDDHWNYMCDLMKKTIDALHTDAPDDFFNDKQTLYECIEQMLDAKHIGG